MSMSKITKAETKYSSIYEEAKKYKQNKMEYKEHKKNKSLFSMKHAIKSDDVSKANRESTPGS